RPCGVLSLPARQAAFPVSCDRRWPVEVVAGRGGGRSRWWPEFLARSPVGLVPIVGRARSLAC
ncbi:MAG: hypothetical protein ACKOJF_25865, partial [Planctomycetaceae bacterium]